MRRDWEHSRGGRIEAGEEEGPVTGGVAGGPHTWGRDPRTTPLRTGDPDPALFQGG